MAPLIWLVTGTTSGIGAALIEHIVSRGDKVIATGRKAEERLAHLKSDNLAVLDLDVTAGRDLVAAQVKKAWDIFGHVDVVVNNAGAAGMKAAEEADDTYIDKLFQINLFGPMHVTQAALPLLRAQGQGILAFTSSSSAIMPLPFLSHYSAVKAALSNYVECLHKELRGQGIKCIAFECGAFATNLGAPREASGEVGFSNPAPSIAGYGPVFADLMAIFTQQDSYIPGDVKKLAKAMVDVIKGEGVAEGKGWVRRLAMGCDSRDGAKKKLEEHLRVLEEWKDVSYSTDRDGFGHSAAEPYLAHASMAETAL